MISTIIEKFADWLFPFLLGLAVWYCLHYIVLTPRIMRVDLAGVYKNFAQEHDLPPHVGTCVQENITPAMLQIGRPEAALFTASLRQVSGPYDEKLRQAEQSLDDKCGVKIARRQVEERERRSLESEIRKQSLQEAQEQMETVMSWLMRGMR